jgi:hypothetical protein
MSLDFLSLACIEELLLHSRRVPYATGCNLARCLVDDHELRFSDFSMY